MSEQAELLLAMQAMMEKLEQSLRQEITQLSTNLREEIAQLGTDLRGEMAQQGTDLRGEMAQLENRLDYKIDETRTGLMAYMESHLERDIKTLAEGHQLLLERFPAAEGLENLRERVDTLEHNVADLSGKVNALKNVS